MKTFNPKTDRLDNNAICIAGIPFDLNSSYKKGPRLAPGQIRESYFCESSNLWTENGNDLGTIETLYDVGDFISPIEKNAFKAIEAAIAQLFKKNCRVISLGGDHSITYPIVKAAAKIYPDLNIFHLDAHPDLYDELEGNRFSHACPFARIMEETSIKRMVQAGIRTMNGHQRSQAERFGVEVFEMNQGTLPLKDLSFDGPVYLSIDMDCLDPAFAPGVSHHEPGGMTTRELIDIIQNFKGNIIGADIVEYNPDQDLNSMTGMVAAKLLKEVIDRIYTG